jgi:hypothetical protein
MHRQAGPSSPLDTGAAPYHRAIRGACRLLALRCLLGGLLDTVAAYASVGYYRPGDACDKVAAELELPRTRLYRLHNGWQTLPSSRPQLQTARRSSISP